MGEINRTLYRWRFIDTGWLTAVENMALDETILKAHARGIVPNTIRFLQFSRPAVLVGFHQDIRQEVRLDFCRENGIDVNRRITGGGAIYFDEKQIGWEIFSDKGFFRVSIANPNFFKQLCQPVVASLKRFGITASFRPRNDIEIQGRKISGTGGTEEKNTFLFQGTLLLDLDLQMMFRALKVPIEKLKDKEIMQVKDRVTCVRWETGRTIDPEKMKETLRRSFEQAFGISLEESPLTDEEEDLFQELKRKFASEEWIDRVKVLSDEQQTFYALNKTRGGLLRITLQVDHRKGSILKAYTTGDFFAYPKRSIYDLDGQLTNIPLKRDVVREKITRFFSEHNPKIPGLNLDDFFTTYDKIFEKIELTKVGIPSSFTNHIFTVNSSFDEIIESRPEHLLLPYCSKSLDCGFRHRRDCAECGECSIGEAYQKGRNLGMKVMTILSFEDLMATLNRIRSPYIGCCCEPFFIKHQDDFERSNIPAILVDIDNSTCYDLNQADLAHEGRFENQTALRLEVLKSVLDRL